ncbi:hypothetical protein [Mycolicibacterium mageritense]|uniref:hypothetical protein n=1 Tax=Mycolicibacterium mageritense TaxID=53462 RepID=UPI001E3493D6|nr:hypothetical protein [Mycolicibacterium mageritense]GJJ22308.1 hypothetical protein MTY414_59810 [Mycolicibacterium mageritense]
MTGIPNTRLTETLRNLWACTEGCEPWEEWYARQCEGGTANGRAIAAILFDRARLYWPDFFSPADGPALAVWGDIIDRWHPFTTPAVIEQAVDAVYAAGVVHPVPGHFTQAAERIMRTA